MVKTVKLKIQQYKNTVMKTIIYIMVFSSVQKHMLFGNLSIISGQPLLTHYQPISYRYL